MESVARLLERESNVRYVTPDGTLRVLVCVAIYVIAWVQTNNCIGIAVNATQVSEN